MGLETATYLDDLVITNPVAGDLVAEGDNHLRMIKEVLKTTFPSFSRPFRHDVATASAASATLTDAEDRSTQDVDASGGARTITLPTSPSAGYEVTVSKSDSSANAVTIARGGSNTINGTTSYTLPRQFSAAKFKYVGGGLWVVVASTTFLRGPSASVDDELVLFSGTTGDLLKRATTTGLLKATSGVLSAATAGTDYYAPGGTDVALADGGTGNSLADPGADRILFWDDSAGAVTWLTIGTNLSITDTTISATGGGGGGSGDVVGPASATDNGFVKFDGTTGKLVKNSAVTVAIATEVSGLGTGIATFLATPTSANLAAAITNETGSGVLVFGTSPSFTTDIRPASNDGASLGINGTAWSDLFLATGAVINWAGGGITITEASDVLQFAGAASYRFDNALFPATNDAAALGNTTLMWSDLFLASGGVLNFNNGDVTLTHATNQLLFAGASSGYLFDGVVVPTTSDGAALGNTANMWSDLFLATGGVINWNNGNYTITHSSALLTLSGALSIGTSNVFTAGTIELGHASANTLSASSGVLSIEGVALLKINGNQTLTGGFSQTAYNLGNMTSFTVTPANGNYQYGTNNAAFTLTAPASDCAVEILVSNHASTAGAITFSGFTAPSGGGGDTYATTGSNKYLLFIRRINGTSTYSWKALQ